MWRSVVLASFLVVGALAQKPTDEPGGKANYTFRNQYMALMPKVMRPGQMFDVSITHIDPPRDGTPISVKVGLRTLDAESELLLEKDDSLSTANCIQSGPCPVTKVVSFKVPDDLDKSKYNVTVSGMSGSVGFYNSTEVTVKKKVYSIFIQTDRAIYKPSQTIQFRVLTVDSDLKPVEKPLNVTILDPSQNRLKQWLNVKSPTGVITRNFSLSDQPPLGDWYINVVGQHVGEKKTFEVAEYVLPKYEVTLDVPSFMLVTMDKITVTTTVKYTYGQPVKGQCTLYVAVDQTYYYSPDPPKSLNITQKLENGKVDYTIEITQMAGLLPPANSKYDKREARERLVYKQILFSASCREELTGKVTVKNDTSRFVGNKFLLTFMSNTADNFKPGLIYNAFVKLMLADNTPPSQKDLVFPGNGSRIPVKLYDQSYMGGDRDMSQPMALTYPNDDGIAVFKIKAGKDISSLNLRVTFDDGKYEVSAYKYVKKFITRDGATLQIRMINTGNLVKAGEEAKFNITTSVPSSVMNFQILAKGELVRSEAAVFTSSMDHAYTLPIDDVLAQQLAPKARIVAWYVTDTNEVVSDSVDFKVDGAFRNDVSLKFSTNKTKPGTDVIVTVTAEANSYVGLLAVDQSSLLLASGNDITQEMVTDELETYDSTNDKDGNMYPIPFFGRGKRSIWCPWCYFSTGGKDSNEVFMNSGVIYLTDIYTYVEPMQPYFMFPLERGVRGPLRGVMAPAAPAAPSGPSSPDDSTGLRSSSPGGPGAPAPRVRTKFPETWLWTDTLTGPDGRTEIKTQTPDTITSWVASAFAMHHSKGLGITDHTSQITVFKPFFVSLDLPYSVIRGEELELKITVFNYQPKSLTVALKVKKSLEFAVEEPNGIEFTHADVETTIEVNANDGKTLSLWIKPVVLGNVAIQVEARSSLAADAVRRMLLVEAEGVTKGYDVNFLVEVPTGQESYMKSELVTLPTEEEGLVLDSVRVTAAAIGDIMGPAMNNLNNLVKMPYGCGEQNMLNFAPNIFVMNYLRGVGRSEPDLEEKAIQYMEKGYQRELTYQRSDGSFSAFGNSDKSGSTWLTAFVVKSFYQARNYIDIDMFNVARSVNWILEQQMPSGAFNEPGRVIHTDMQGGSASGVTLTAYVTVSLLEMKDMEELDKDRVSSAIKKSLDYLKTQLKAKTVKNDPYVLAIVTCALALSDDPLLTFAVDDLTSMAISTNGMTHWEKTVSPYKPLVEDDVIIWKPPQQQAKASAIENTAYAMLIYVQVDKMADAVPIMRWLVSQRNSLGGYGSTQDTVMALQALASFGMKSSGSGETKLKVHVESSAGKFSFPEITSANDMVLQKQQIGMSGFEDLFTVTAQGQGMALVQISVSYNLLKTTESPDIELDVVSSLKNNKTVNVDVCATYLPKVSSGMVVLETSMLSGYEPVNINELKEKTEALKRVDQSDKTLYFYLDELQSGQRTCLNVITSQVNKVSKLQKAKVKAYPYYAPHMMKTSFYLPRELALAPSCSDGECRVKNGVEFEYTNKQAMPRKIETIYKGHMIYPRPGQVAAGSTSLHMTAFTLMTLIILTYLM